MQNDSNGSDAKASAIVQVSPNVKQTVITGDRSVALLAMAFVTIIALVVIAVLVLPGELRNDDTDKFIDEFDDAESAIGTARRAVSRTLSAYTEPDGGSIRRFRDAVIHYTPEDRERALARFGRMIVQSRLNSEFEEIILFFERAYTCIEAKDCNSERMAERLGPYAARFWINFGALIRTKRIENGTEDYGIGLEKIAEAYSGRDRKSKDR